MRDFYGAVHVYCCDKCSLEIKDFSTKILLLVGKNLQLAELVFSDLSDLADALAVPDVLSVLESFFEGIFNLLCIELPNGIDWIVRTLLVISSPLLPSPRVAACTNKPFS